jgi:hypothetical protein
MSLTRFLADIRLFFSIITSWTISSSIRQLRPFVRFSSSFLYLFHYRPIFVISTKGALDGFLSAARAASYTLRSLYYYRTEFSVWFRCYGTSSLDDDYLYDYLFECKGGRKACDYGHWMSPSRLLRHCIVSLCRTKATRLTAIVSLDKSLLKLKNS